MSNELQDEELDIDISMVDLEADTVICPQCKNVVPVSLYCVTCNSPLEVNGGDSNEISGEEIEEFDVANLREMMGEDVVQIEENMENPSSNDFVGSNDMKFKSAPSNHKLMLPVKEPSGMSVDELDEVRVNEDPIDVTSRGKDNEIDPRIKQLADDLFKSIYLELWSVKLLEKSEINEAHFLRIFQSYRDRFEGCIAQRDHFLEKYGELEEFDNKARDSRIELQELEVRRGLGDLAKGEYEALGPALRWVISFNESEKDRRENLLAILEDLSFVMPREGILEIKAMTENSERVIDEMASSNRLSQEIVDEVGDSIKRINGLLSVKVKDLD